MKKLKLLMILTAMLIVPSFAFSSTIDQISSFAVTANSMDGMGVAVTFNNGTANQTWQDIGGATSGVSGVSGSNWSFKNIRYSDYYSSILPPGFSWDDTMENPWVLSSHNSTLGGIASITINAIPAGIVFDIINSRFGTYDSRQGWWDANGSAGTASSGNGYLTLNSSGQYSIDPTATSGQYYSWSFSDPVALTASPSTFDGDVWGAFTLNFDNPETQDAVETFSGDLVFSLDTDTSAVPEPATMLLFGLGLLGISAVSRKKYTA